MRQLIETVKKGENSTNKLEKIKMYMLCSKCFNDFGLIKTVESIGIDNNCICENCKKSDGFKITKEQLEDVCMNYFIDGTFCKSNYGGSCLVMYNYVQKTEIKVPKFLKNDIKLLEDNLGIGFFYYSPRLYNLGLVEPLDELLDKKTRKKAINNIISKFPSKIIDENFKLFRLRKNPVYPNKNSEYDSPPNKFRSNYGRFDSKNINILYASENIEICIHECRVTLADELYIANLSPTKSLKLLDLTNHIDEQVAPFESLNLAIQFIFEAENHSYEITRDIAKYLKIAGYDGVVYNSYFNKIKPIQIPNIAIFGSPIRNKKIKIDCINKLIIKEANYSYIFGPTIIE